MEETRFKNEYTREEWIKHVNDSLPHAKHQAIEAAKDLRYPEEVIKEIKNCKSLGSLSVIMSTARHRYL